MSTTEQTTIDATALLADAVARYSAQGWRVEHVIGTTATLAKGYGKSPRHGFHLLMGAVTFGVWLPVYAVCALKAYQFRTRRTVVSVDQFGTVTERRL